MRCILLSIALIEVIGSITLCTAAASSWQATRQDEAARPPAASQPVPRPASQPVSKPDSKDDDDDGEIAATRLKAGDDDRKTYFLISNHDLAKPPAAGFKLLLVLPGGDGSEAFLPFVKRIASHAVPEDFVVAQIVAPKWSDAQAGAVVWPTQKSEIAEAKFTTEELIDSVINDVKAHCRIDPACVCTLAWSSSGPAAYAASLTDKTQVTGSFVAMSVFNPEYLPDLKNAKGQAYYLFHSPQDFIKMRFPESARDHLTEHGASTTLVTYQGGHGWHGDVYGDIRAGIDWLIEHTSKK